MIVLSGIYFRIGKPVSFGMKYILAILNICLLVQCTTQSAFHPEVEEVSIRKILHDQEIAWNEGRLEDYMEGYWKSDSLIFIGSEISYGWNSTLNRYKRVYPDQAARGTLRFEILRVSFVSADACQVTGKYYLTREADSPNGVFTLLFRKHNAKWVIVYDHTS